jgi:hypothetical protein
MTISSLLLRVVFLGLPGIICFFLYRMFTTERNTRSWEDVLKIGVFALMSYLLYSSCFMLARLVFGGDGSIRFYDALFNEKTALPPWEVTGASIAGVVLAFVAAAVDNRKLINKLARRVRVTNRFGDDDVWLFLHNIPRNTQWAFVRDHKVGLTYYGWIDVFSDSEKERELLLTQVDVYDAASDRLYSTPTLYICREKHDLSIEFPVEFPEDVSTNGETHLKAKESPREEDDQGN